MEDFCGGGCIFNLNVDHLQMVLLYIRFGVMLNFNNIKNAFDQSFVIVSSQEIKSPLGNPRTGENKKNVLHTPL